MTVTLDGASKGSKNGVGQQSSSPIAGVGTARPFDVRYVENPSQDELRKLALEHTPAIVKTKQGSLVKVSRNKNRVAKWTYVIATPEEGKEYNISAIDPAKARELIARQAEYIKSKGQLIAIDGYLGLGPRAVGVEWLYTLEGANIAGMQQTLSFTRAQVEGDAATKTPFKPALRIVYSPNLFFEDMPGKQAIIVDLANWTTYIIGADYFGESKKGALRMLNEYVYRQNGLVLHAGAKAVHTAGREITVTIMGESGTGKTTTTFSKQGKVTQPIQDDMVSLWPNGEMSVTENGCFAKTEGLTSDSEPTIYHASMDPTAWLENIYVDRASGTVDFLKGRLAPGEVKSYREEFILTNFKAENIDKYISGEVKYEDVVDAAGTPKDGWDFVSWTQNGRSIVPMASIKEAADLNKIPPVKSMGILNRDEGPDACTPGLVRFTSPAQAAGFFMVGETSKTSAAGKDRGKMRSPFTQPFFPRQHGLQASRFREIAATMPDVDVWMMNTGCIGGDAADVKAGKALKVRIPFSSAMLEAMLTGQVKWTRDPDFGYEVVDVNAPENKDLLAKVPAEVLQPKLFFEKAGRAAEYSDWVARMKKERRGFLTKFGVDEEIIRAIGA